MKNLPGVFKAQKKNGDVYYRSSITFRSKHISLGSFDNEEDANAAYNDATAIIQSENTYFPDDFSKTICQKLDFKKWVSLINFKNNGIYIKTPIYMRNKFFNYYLSKNDVLTFDVDDLFYYSNHSIMRRGTHLFVAEYGMQTNIASRYGIRNFARKDIDFRFVNGDINDFRYANIEIINPYQGVTVETANGITSYISKIHINGYNLIGKYDKIEHAAIAYNKAVDMLADNDCTTNYEKNYINDYSNEEYMEIYKKIHIPSKIFEK